MLYDIIIVGSGPGGYVAALRASKLGKKVALVERSELGGVCLNWGCIPTKALLRSAHVYQEMLHAEQFGVEVSGEVTVNFEKVIARSRNVSATMSKGVQFLLSKSGVTIVNGFGRLKGAGEVEVTDGDNVHTINAKDIILATGSRARELPNVPIDGRKIISYREALSLSSLPSSMVVIGSGAIGVELAQFYHSMGSKVTIVEYLPNLVPLEDDEVSKYLERSFRKAKLPYLTSTKVDSVDIDGDMCRVNITTAKGSQTLDCEVVLSAVGVVPNIENIGLEEVGVNVDKGKIVVEGCYKTSVDGIYAIGDIINTPSLAHVASAEAICCVEAIAGISCKPVNYDVIPSCIYTTPEISSVGLSEREALSRGYDIRVGRFPYTASGRAVASGDKDGFVKLIFSSTDDKLLGAHLIGASATEMIMEAGVAITFGLRAEDLISIIHPHPTLSESLMEAAAASHGQAIHI